MLRAPTSDVLRRAVENAVSGEDAVAAAYLFGSAARGVSGPLSDVDVAVLLRPQASDEGIFDRLADRLCQSLDVSRVDVVDLGTAPLPLRYRVIRDGMAVVSRSPAYLERFIVETTLHYLDFAPLRDRAFRLQRAAILGQGR